MWKVKTVVKKGNKNKQKNNNRAQPGSNRWPIDLQSIALPLSYGPIVVFLFGPNYMSYE